jgi:hypothetical protein
VGRPHCSQERPAVGRDGQERRIVDLILFRQKVHPAVRLVEGEYGNAPPSGTLVVGRLAVQASRKDKETISHSSVLPLRDRPSRKARNSGWGGYRPHVRLDHAYFNSLSRKDGAAGMKLRELPSTPHIRSRLVAIAQPH